jgi:hypothetical protein
VGQEKEKGLFQILVEEPLSWRGSKVQGDATRENDFIHDDLSPSNSVSEAELNEKILKMNLEPRYLDKMKN